MAENLSKKFALLCSCLMTMQALRLIISTAGFCVVRFHIDCELFNIFISRLVNAVMMSQLFGNWLGDLIVFGASGVHKIIAAALANWAELICFCFALYCICNTEVGHLTGFYWSMVLAYFWWKVGEAPTTSIAAPESTDYYFAGFTLSGVWASCLKGLVMRCVTQTGTNTVSFQSDALGDVNLTVVGARSVKTTVDYRASKYLFIITIVLTFLMCLPWSVVKWLVTEEKGKTESDGQWQKDTSGDKTRGVVEADKIGGLSPLAGIAFGGVLAVPGAMLGAGVGWVFALCFKCCLSVASYAKLTKRCQLIFGIVGALGTFSGTVAVIVLTAKGQETWVEWFKWADNWGQASFTWPIGGLGVGMGTGAVLGLSIGACTGSKKRGTASGALVGSFVGLLTGEIKSGTELWGISKNSVQGAAKDWEWAVYGSGIFIVVGGLGTVYSIYPGMAPCSITQFKYFNIIDILILALSAIAPLVIMGVDLADQPWKLGNVITKAAGPEAGKLDSDTQQALMGVAIACGLVMTVATLICEIIVLHIMQHPFGNLAQKITNSGWRAVLLTVTMVTCQLTSSGVGFGCVAAGSGFNDGVVNVNSTLTLWSVECTGVLGEGYLTELKKYEPGKWPTQGMGKWATYKWWNRKAFGNAWQIWCCIGTTDLRRDIMLCRQ